ncbi:hypothetical protein HWV62_21966 [Athelia sp. TMB]|nr:hypothetical protein HWV62_21966 [Athelia sp. TMB]
MPERSKLQNSDRDHRDEARLSVPNRKESLNFESLRMTKQRLAIGSAEDEWVSAVESGCHRTSTGHSDLYSDLELSSTSAVSPALMPRRHILRRVGIFKFELGADGAE